jgi:hypothetical protein
MITDRRSPTLVGAGGGWVEGNSEGTLNFIFLTKGSSLKPGHTSSLGVPSILNIWSIIWSSVWAFMRGSLQSISAKMQPTAHMSISHEYSLAPRSSSGARYL